MTDLAVNILAFLAFALAALMLLTFSAACYWLIRQILLSLSEDKSND
jgi:hypothetical protein